MTRRCWDHILLGLEIAAIAGGAIVAYGLWLEGSRGLGGTLVVIGVVVEVFTSVWVLFATRRVQSLQDQEFAEAAMEIGRLRKRIAGRRAINSKEFMEVLRDQPAGEIFDILYPKDDGEAYDFAMEIAMALLTCGWVVGKFSAIQAKTGDPYDQLPSAASVGGAPTGITIAMQEIPSTGQSTPALTTLSKVFFDPSGQPLLHGDPSLPTGVFRIIVGSKRA